MNTPFQDLAELLFGRDAFDKRLNMSDAIVISAAYNRLKELEAILARALKSKDELQANYEAILDLNDRHVRELSKANNELARLRPPEPKFRVGQVIKYGNGQGYYRILAMRTNAISTGKWEYELPYVGWQFECTFRALTDAEK